VPSVEGWPARLCLIRHGESSGNVARDYAEANGLERIQLEEKTGGKSGTWKREGGRG
jgi:hypothetical protein